MIEFARHPRILVDPAVHHGQPVVRGTRVPVAIIVGSLAGGMTIDEVVDAYGVQVEDVRAALQFAADSVQQDRYHALSA